jgi:secondary thiamine-phosphate synthase enzyme
VRTRSRPAHRLLRAERSSPSVLELRLRTERQSQLVDITLLVQDAVAEAWHADASAALVYVPHTTAGVTVNEHADPAVARDFEAALERIVPADWPWQHVEEGEENAPTHIRASFMGPSVVIPLRDDGTLALGTWQGVFFCEFDGPRERSVYVSLLR